MMSRMMTTTLEVTDISNATLDAALFDVPAGYTPADNPAELYSGGPFGAGGPPGVFDDERPIDVERPTAVDRPTQARVGAGVPAKREGVMRVGVPSVKRYEARVEFRLIASDGRMVLQSAETAAGDYEASSISAALQKEAQAVIAAARGRS